jgi:hypothetical protein
MHLTLDSHLRTTSVPAEIANLKRKGWVETTPPSYDAATHYAPTWQAGQWVVGGLLPPPEPVVVTMRSFRLAAGRSLMIQINAAIAAIEDIDQRWQAQQFLTTSPTVSRTHSLVLALAAVLGKSDDAVDAIFAAAQTIDANI